MKVIKILGHPVLLISVFLLLIIEGDNFGGIYLLYLLLAAPHGAPYALIALLGLIAVFIGYKVYRTRFHPLKITMYLIGLGLMLLSLVLFFAKGNKNATFELTIPLLSLIIFGVISIFFLINIFFTINLGRTTRNQPLNSIV